MRRIEIDFWDSRSILKGISQIYNVPEQGIIQLLNEIPEQEELLATLFEKYKIYPDIHSLDGIYIKCKLIGKYPDKALMEKQGLMSLTELLKREDSFLVRFLNDFGIHIDVDKLIFQFGNKVVNIDPLSDLGNKLCHDNGEIEAFYFGSSAIIRKWN